MARQRRARGEGGLTQLPDGTWRAYVSLPDGRRRYFRAPTQKAALAKLRAALRAVEEGLPLPDQRVTVAAFLEAWLAGVAPSVRETSLRRYRQVLTQYAVPALGTKRLARLAPEDLQRLYAEKLGSGLSAPTVRLLHFVLHRALKDAERWGRCARNVADLVDPPRLPRKEAGVLSPAEAAAVLDAVRGHPLEALFVLAIKTGMRRGELLGLRWRDVDLDAGVLRVSCTLQPTSRGTVPRLVEPKSPSSRRTVTLSTPVVELLKVHRKQQTEHRLRVGSDWTDNDLVFASAFGSWVPPGTVLRVWARLLDAAGVEHIPFHSTRHTAATLMLSAGVSPRVASERLGHSTVAMTLDRYSHVTAALRHEAATAVDRVLELAVAGDGGLSSDRVPFRVPPIAEEGMTSRDPSSTRGPI